MSLVKIYVSAILLEGSSKRVSLEASTVGEALEKLLEIIGQEFRRKIYEGESLNPRIVVLLNNRNIRFLDGLKTKISNGDLITILPAIAGGQQLEDFFKPEEYYKRQMVLPEIGPEGQKRLRNSSALIIGMGGLGTTSTLYLALAGVGKLKLVDQDVVDINNLHRQILYTMHDFRLPKVEAAAKRIKSVNPEVNIESIPENLNEGNADSLIKDVDCVIDGLDNMRTRYLVNRICVKRRIPYVFGGAIGFEGNVSVFNPPDTPCLECILPGLDDAYLPTCETRGVMGATTGIVGAIQAMEAIKLLAGVNEGLRGRLLVCDFITMSFETVKLEKNPECAVCGAGVKEAPKHEGRLVWLCGSNTVNINPPKFMSIDLTKAYEALKQNFRILTKSSLALTISYGESIEATLFRSGRMLVRNVKDEQQAIKVYDEVLRLLT